MLLWLCFVTENESVAIRYLQFMLWIEFRKLTLLCGWKLKCRYQNDTNSLCFESNLGNEAGAKKLHIQIRHGRLNGINRRGRQQALFDVVRKRWTSLPNWAFPWQKNCGKYETLRLNLKKIRFVVRFCMKCKRTEHRVFCKQPQTEWREIWFRLTLFCLWLHFTCSCWAFLQAYFSIFSPSKKRTIMFNFYVWFLPENSRRY